MLARDYHWKDANALDHLLGLSRAGDVRLDRDRIVCCGPVGRPFASLVWRPSAFLHEFHCGSGLHRITSASALVSYACGAATAAPHPIGDAMFLVDPMNEHMHRFVQRLGAVKEDGVLYTIPLRITK